MNPPDLAEILRQRITDGSAESDEFQVSELLMSKDGPCFTAKHMDGEDLIVIVKENPYR